MNETVRAMLEDDGAPTAPLDDFLRDYADNDNLWWYLDTGYMQNLFEAATEEIERLRGFERFMHTQAEMFGPAASLTASLAAYERTQQ